MAHHDAAPTGLFFDQSAQEWFGRRFPAVIERQRTTFPNWWVTLAGPVLIGIGALARRRGLVRAGAISSVTAAAALADIARSPIVPGANDNLTAVAVLVALAERLRERPLTGIRVLLVSLGAEEVCQGGIYGFGERHFPELDRERTWFLNVETVGSPHLVLMEGEGTVVMEDYRDEPFRDLVAQVGGPGRCATSARNALAQQHRLGDPEPRRVPDRDDRLHEPLQRDVQLPPDVRHARERRLPNRRAGPDRHRGDSAGLSVPLSRGDWT